jgi:hypothetical protein
MPAEAGDSRITSDKAVVSKELLGCVVVAFMQNMWVRDPEKVKASIERMHWMKRDEYRLRLIHYSLFAGCVSGRRLKAAFGEMCDAIIWEEASPEIAGDPKTICLPVPRHIQCALEHHNPDIVITFGKLAGDAVAKLWPAKLIRVCHPAARQPDTIQKLKAAADELRTFAKQPNEKLRHSAPAEDSDNTKNI